MDGTRTSNENFSSLSFVFNAKMNIYIWSKLEFQTYSYASDVFALGVLLFGNVKRRIWVWCADTWIDFVFRLEILAREPPWKQLTSIQQFLVSCFAPKLQTPLPSIALGVVVAARVMAGERMRCDFKLSVLNDIVNGDQQRDELFILFVNKQTQSELSSTTTNNRIRNRQRNAVNQSRVQIAGDSRRASDQSVTRSSRDSMICILCSHKHCTNTSSNSQRHRRRHLTWTTTSWLRHTRHRRWRRKKNEKTKCL